MTMTKDKTNFIVIDDSKLDCFIAEKIIQTSGKSETIKTFLQASEALDYIKDKSASPDDHTILFVDIQMPVMNGFEFVEAFDSLPADRKSAYTIYMLSSSINENDIAKVRSLAAVKQFINKPLTVDAVKQIFENQNV
ncbi:MAG: response regulator [Sphingobacteriales bacterium]|nr:MAG: response regulator [Sphingobacteriales bacterium]